MRPPEPLIDIHCHILPEMDDGADSWHESLSMAKLAHNDGITAIVATPHQLGAYTHNTPAAIRHRVKELQSALAAASIPLKILPGADVRIEHDIVEKIEAGGVMTLADKGRHVLLEFPHTVVVPLEGIISALQRQGIQVILTHPERNRRILRDWPLVERLVEHGCLMQVTAGALTGAFGPAIRGFAEWLIQERLVQFVASDAHGPKSRRPLLSRAFHRIAQLVDASYAAEVCCENPYRAVRGESIPVLERRNRTFRFANWFKWRRAA